MNTLMKTENILTEMRENKYDNEKFEGKMPKYSQFLRTFGEMVIVKDNRIKMKGKLKDRGI